MTDTYQYEVAKLLFLRKIKATFFLIPCLREFEGKPLLTIYPQLIRKISMWGHEIGSHSCTHPDLTMISSLEIEKELELSKKYLEKMLGLKIKTFAYPYGKYNDNLIKLVSKYYESARSVWDLKSPLYYTIDLRYKIPALDERKKDYIKLLSLLLTRYRGIVLVFHSNNLRKLFLIINLLEKIGANFVTLTEFVDKVMNVK